MQDDNIYDNVSNTKSYKAAYDNKSQVSVCGRIHCCISAVLVCISIALAGAVIAGFLVQKYEISKLQQ